MLNQKSISMMTPPKSKMIFFNTIFPPCNLIWSFECKDVNLPAFLQYNTLKNAMGPIAQLVRAPDS